MHPTSTTFSDLMEHVAQGFEVLAAALLVLGLVGSLIDAAVRWVRTRSAGQAYGRVRAAFGGTLLLGVEILVAADLVRTIAVAPTLENVAVLGIVVVIRTFLSFSLEVEMAGVVPWRRALVGADVPRRPTTRAGTRDGEQTEGGHRPDRAG